MAVEMDQEVLLTEFPPPVPKVETSPRSREEAETGNHPQYEEPPSENSPAMKLQQNNLHWLAYVLIVTAVLLVYQVVAGFCANSLALIADSSHSTLDVISYGMNYVVEKWKVRNRGGYAITESCVGKADLIGGIVSTLTLIVATWFASQEAIDRLFGEASDKSEFENIGEVLLAFAVVSTLANSFLVLYYVKQQAQLSILPAPPSVFSMDVLPAQPSVFSMDVLPAPPSVVAPLEPSTAPDLSTARKDSGSASPLLAIPALPTVDSTVDLESPMASTPASPASSRSTSKSRQNRRKAKSPVNLRKAYSSSCTNDDCAQDACLHDLQNVNGNSDSISANSVDRQTNLFALLHIIVHPGCTDAAGAASSCCGREHDKQENLNLSAAMLHLIADVVRGITILISAILIQTGMVSDAGKADAVCALLVALFILIGAVAIFQRIANSLCKSSS